uniref:Ribonuclease A-domain domain-containing protein n=1 Tax=Cyprinodon variegatus TaxID=28743 RepID=A0A3Q2CTQ8_CYPVA
MDSRTIPVSSMLARHCNGGMQRINAQIGDCKWENTFIIDLNDQLRTICNTGSPSATSHSWFPIVDCTLVRGSLYPNCNYKGRNIIVSCNSSLPVHYEKDHTETWSSLL